MNYLAGLLLAVCLLSSVQSKYTPDWESLDSRPLPAWFDEAKVGIFLHWGVFSVPSFGSEWFWSYWNSKSTDYVNFMKKNFKPGFSYPEFAPKFTAEFYNPEQWAEIFEAAGAKPLPSWYDDVKVGIFIHWGVFSVPGFGSEWFWKDWSTNETGFVDFMDNNFKPNFTYPEFAPQFTAEFYDPEKWAEIFEASGAKQIPVFEFLGDLAKAIRSKTDLHFGVYHSMFDWFHPLYLLDKQNKYSTQYFVDNKALPELFELVNNYRPEVIWSDGDWEASDTYWKSKEFLAWLYNESPVKDVVAVNDRWGANIPCKHGGYYTCSDRYNPKTLQAHKWENAMTLDKGSWGFRRNVELSDYLTIEELVTTLAETVSCGGNLLINVGPTHDGRIIPIFEERLRQFGDWMKINGEAIYGTTPWKAQNDTLTPGVWYTSKGDDIYAIVLSWPKNNVLQLGALQTLPGDKIYMLGVDDPLEYSQAKKVAKIIFPVLPPNELPSTYAWVLKVTQ
ncbi:Alpha-L-fucosidase like protein [Argiope bruennichi]|uniref:alpha-L-fucosidase n=1 Tax=Argiope bruennichi TaxID=94029 RepID=A0A8T0FYZ0_ARGBR|nr:Alpha-L-fucosidase like protein [Argiope bruennichi]